MLQRAEFPLATLVAELESDSLNLKIWEKLQETVRLQNDSFSSQSLAVIVEGLQAWEFERKNGSVKNASAAARANFTRLARSYNNPGLLKEIGRFYLQEGNNSSAAVKHLQRALQLGGSAKEIQPLLEAADLILETQKEAMHDSALLTVGPSQPLIREMISKSGKLTLQAQNVLPPRTGPLARIKRSSTSLPTTPQACLAEAEKALDQGNDELALQLMKKVNQSPLSCDEMWHGWSSLGLSFFEKGDYAQAEKAYEEAARYRPEEMASHFNLGTARQLNQNFSGALAAYHKAEAQEPNHPKVWCNLGALFCQQDDYLEAEKALRRALAAEPAYARAWDNLGVALGAQDRLEEALQASRRAVELKPRYPEASFKIGLIEFSRNLWVEAVEHLQLARQLPALAPYALAYLTLAYVRMEKMVEAQETVQELVAQDPHFEMLSLAWNALGSAWFTAGKFSQAVHAHRCACALKPDEASSWFNLGMAQLYDEEPGQARESLQRAIDLQFQFPSAWHHLGLACTGLGRFAEATAAFQQAARFNPEKARAWQHLATSLEKEGLWEKAQEAYHKAHLLRNRSGTAQARAAA